MNQKSTTLPNKEALARRLSHRMDDYQIEKLLPHIQKMFGESEKVGPGIVLGLNLAIYSASEGLPPIITMFWNQQIPEFIDVMVDDEEVKADALAFYNEVNGKK